MFEVNQAHMGKGGGDGGGIPPGDLDFWLSVEINVVTEKWFIDPSLILAFWGPYPPPWSSEARPCVHATKST